MLPSAVDFVRDSGNVNLINVTDASGAIIATRSRPEATGATKTVFQLARALRLIKLARLLRASRVLARWQARISVGYGTVVVTKCLIKILFACHWCRRVPTHPIPHPSHPAADGSFPSRPIPSRPIYRPIRR
jgi:hypothetical protein